MWMTLGTASGWASKIDLSAQRAAVEAEIESLGIPAGAVLIEEVPPERPASDLKDFHRPLVGGLQIESTFFICTLGFVALKNGVPSIITNSHCTDTQGGVESTVFGQPLVATVTAVESADPNYFTGGACPAGKQCRYSDAARADICCVWNFEVGRIADPQTQPIIDPSDWNGTSKFRVVGEAGVVVGNVVRKVGRTTGETSGTVSAVCVNVNQSGSNFTILCENQANYGALGGDSGAPVFRITSGSDVNLVGMNWGSTTFSPMGTSGIQRSSELGTLTNCASGFSC